MSKTKTKSSKPTKKKTETVHVCFLLDESGSMTHNQQAAVEGYNDFVAKLKQENKDKQLKVTLGMFDLDSMLNLGEESVVRFTFKDQAINDLRLLTSEDYQPRGSTPLYDAIIETLTHMDTVVKDDQKAIVVILTDGYENASSSGADKRARKMIAEREAKDWAFVYLGSNQDAWQGTSEIGLNKHGASFNTVSSKEGIRTQMRSAGSMAALYSRDSKADYDRKMKSYSRRSQSSIDETEEVTVEELDREE